MMSEKDLDRFWSKVEKSDDCWVWTKTTRNGYGIFRLKKKMLSAHRVSYKIANPDEDIEKLKIRHTCDNPPCVNPSHLVSGTPKQNTEDMMVRDRHIGNLSNAQVLDMRSRPMHADVCRELAEEFEIDPSAVKDILSGHRYGHLPGSVNLPPQNRARSLNDKELSEIVEALKNPYWGQLTQLAAKYNVSIPTIYGIKHGRHKSALNHSE